MDGQASYLPVLKKLTKKLAGTYPRGQHGIVIVDKKARSVNDQRSIFIQIARLRQSVYGRSNS